MFPGLIDKLQHRVDLTVEEAAGAMETIMDGRAQPSQVAGFLVGLAMKGERPDEIVGLARTMRGRATKLSRSLRTRRLKGPSAVGSLVPGGAGNSPTELSISASPARRFSP